MKDLCATLLVVLCVPQETSSRESSNESMGSTSNTDPRSSLCIMAMVMKMDMDMDMDMDMQEKMMKKNHK